jgi:hypothetical protein
MQPPRYSVSIDNNLVSVTNYIATYVKNNTSPEQMLLAIAQNNLGLGSAKTPEKIKMAVLLIFSFNLCNNFLSLAV